MRISVVVLSTMLAAGSLHAWQPGAEQDSVDALRLRGRFIAKHMLRLQQERFEAQARGDGPETREAIARRLRHTQARHRQITQAIEAADQP